MVATALLRAERQVADLLSRGQTAVQRTALDGLLEIHPPDSVSNLAWVRHPAGAPGRRSLARLVEQLKLLRNIGINDDRIAAVHPQRIKQLAQEGTRLTAQHLATLSPGRRRAILVVTVIETSARLWIAAEAAGQSGLVPTGISTNLLTRQFMGSALEFPKRDVLPSPRLSL
jgi:hypothetical protein